MSYVVKQPVVLFATVLWLGFVCAISFMEAWLKFRAPGVTLPIGLSIGRKVFGALNTMEWIFALLILFNLFKEALFWQGLFSALVWGAVLILLVQTLWLLPLLDERAEKLIKGETINHSSLHFYYVGGEIIKSACLFLYGLKLFNH